MHPLHPLTVFSLLAAAAVGQQQISGSAKSQTYFLSAVEFGSGGEADSSTYRIQPSQGSGLVAEPYSQSENYVLTGGFPAALTAPVLGRTWLTSVEPFFVPQFGSPQLTLHGTEMYMGAPPNVWIGGIAAAVGTRTVDRVLVTLPDQPVPGFQQVWLDNDLGPTVLNEGVGVLPMFELREPMNTTDPNRVRYHGTSGDLVILALGVNLTPVPIILAGYGYSLQLDPANIILTNLYLPNQDGQFDIPLPPFPPGYFRVQALVISSNPGYTPGSWTNALAL
jgi:hypothetical protein